LALTAALGASLGGVVYAARLIDDTCGTGYAPYFAALGPAQYWHWESSVGVNSCSMWTYTVYAGYSDDINRAGYFTDPTFDPGTYMRLQAFMTGTRNSCGSPVYRVWPTGDLGSSYSYSVTQAGPGWQTIVDSIYMDPYQGAKYYLGDSQWCPGGSEILVDAGYFWF